MANCAPSKSSGDHILQKKYCLIKDIVYVLKNFLNLYFIKSVIHKDIDDTQRSQVISLFENYLQVCRLRGQYPVHEDISDFLIRTFDLLSYENEAASDQEFQNFIYQYFQAVLHKIKLFSFSEFLNDWDEEDRETWWLYREELKLIVSRCIKIWPFCLHSFWHEYVELLPNCIYSCKNQLFNDQGFSETEFILLLLDVICESRINNLLNGVEICEDTEENVYECYQQDFIMLAKLMQSVCQFMESMIQRQNILQQDYLQSAMHTSLLLHLLSAQNKLILAFDLLMSSRSSIANADDEKYLEHCAGVFLTFVKFCFARSADYEDEHSVFQNKRSIKVELLLRASKSYAISMRTKKVQQNFLTAEFLEILWMCASKFSHLDEELAETLFHCLGYCVVKTLPDDDASLSKITQLFVQPLDQLIACPNKIDVAAKFSIQFNILAGFIDGYTAAIVKQNDDCVTAKYIQLEDLFFSQFVKLMTELANDINTIKLLDGNEGLQVAVEKLESSTIKCDGKRIGDLIMFFKQFLENYCGICPESYPLTLRYVEVILHEFSVCRDTDTALHHSLVNEIGDLILRSFHFIQQWLALVASRQDSQSMLELKDDHIENLKIAISFASKIVTPNSDELISRTVFQSAIFTEQLQALVLISFGRNELDIATKGLDLFVNAIKEETFIASLSPALIRRLFLIMLYSGGKNEQKRQLITLFVKECCKNLLELHILCINQLFSQPEDPSDCLLHKDFYDKVVGNLSPVTIRSLISCFTRPSSNRASLLKNLQSLFNVIY